MKTILISFLMMVMAGGVYASNAKTEMEARQELAGIVKKAISDEMSQIKNYFYDHDISKMKERVEVTCLVSTNKKIELVRVKCPNAEASDFIAYIFRKNTLRADEMLAGKVFRFDVELRYKAW